VTPFKRAAEKIAMKTRSTVANAGAIRPVVLVASGDLREEANRVCWPAQKALEADVGRALSAAGWKMERAHAPSKARGHGFIASAR
jgi:hypothetical protein